MNKNVTLRLDEAILRKARHAAVETDQSLSEWVANLIVSAVSQQERHSKARKSALKRMEAGFHLGGKPLSRDEIYER